MAMKFLLFLLLCIEAYALPAHASPRDSLVCQWGDTTLTLRTEHESLHHLLLTTPDGTNQWTLPYPIYRITTGDVNGDGSRDIMVGVIKATRFHPEVARRLFIFKNYHGYIRALWMGSKLGGILQDFRFIDGKIRALETTTDGWWVVSDYRWKGFGMQFVEFIKVKVDRQTALDAFL